MQADITSANVIRETQHQHRTFKVTFISTTLILTLTRGYMKMIHMPLRLSFLNLLTENDEEWQSLQTSK